MKARFLQAILGSLGPLLLHIIDYFVNKKVLNKCITLARIYVEKLNGDTSVDNETKRKLVLSQLKDAMKNLGMEVGESVLNLAIEIAVVAAKSQFKK